jgi:DNA modification methylase
MSIRILTGDCRDVLRTLPDASVQCCVTSPPYFGLRQYLPEGHPDMAKQIGLEQSPAEYVAQMVAVFGEVRRVLRDDGVCFVNIGDSYNGGGVGGGAVKGGSLVGSSNRDSQGEGRKTLRVAGAAKNLLGIPWRVAFALQDDGWYLRSDIIWHKPNPMPESVTDRPTKAHEYVFLLTKSARYFWDADAVAEEAIHAGRVRRGPDSRKNATAAQDPMMRTRIAKTTTVGATRNIRTVWTIATQPFSGSHFAVMAPELAERCIKAGSRPCDTVLDPFGGAGTTGLVADRLGRDAILIELNPDYAAMARGRVSDDAGMFAQVVAA